jgi:ADP-ribose pyrophosphatase YjhB (NUDIX family)
MQNIQTVCTIVTTVIAAIGAPLIFYRLYLQYRQSKYTALTELHTNVMFSSIREGVQFIYKRDKADVTLPADKKQRDEIEQVLETYDLIGFRVKKGVLPRAATLETEWSVVWRVWYQMKAFIDAENNNRKAPYKKHLEWLANKAEKYRKSKKYDEPQILHSASSGVVTGLIMTDSAKPCVAVLVEKDNCLLLAERAYEPAKGKWDIPGGFIEPGESAENAAVREILEETGLHIRLTKYLISIPDIYGEANRPTINFCFIAQIECGTERPQSDVASLSWFPLDKLPKDMAFDHQYKVLEMYLSQHS